MGYRMRTNRGERWYTDRSCVWLHREGGLPAVDEKGEDGSWVREWWKLGVQHRDEGPASESSSGDQFWYREGKLHRDDGPAFSNSRFEMWYQNGRLHRVGGPAIVRVNGTQEWCQGGHRHREDGPAVVYHDDQADEYWLYGDQYDLAEYEAYEAGQLVVMTHAGVERLLGRRLRIVDDKRWARVEGS